MNIFTKAALFAEKDNMKGVSANILAGQFCKSGTNSFEILMDEDKLLANIDVGDFENPVYVDVNEKDIDIAFQNAYLLNEPNETITDNDFKFGFGIEQNKQFTLTGTADPLNVLLTNKKEEINEMNKMDQLNIEEISNVGGIDFENIDIEEPNKIKPVVKKIRVSRKKVINKDEK